MKLRTLAALAFATAALPAFGETKYVIHISVDGGGSRYLNELYNDPTGNKLPNFDRFRREGAWTHNARTDYNYTVTLPNHTTQVTGRGVIGVNGNGHGWTLNDYPDGTATTLEQKKGTYVAGVFDVAHDNGLRTAMYATKSKFNLFNVSYDANNGALDTTGVDNGCDKLDTYYYGNSGPATTAMLSAMTGANPYNYAFMHYDDPDNAGHTSVANGGGWGGTLYDQALITVDGYLGQIFNAVTTNTALKGKTAIILTADHGGTYGAGHGNAAAVDEYTIPFYYWGPDAKPNTDLYLLNAARLNPNTGRPDYAAAVQPIRNGDAANLELSLLGLGAIPGSSINFNQDLVVPEPASLALVAAGAAALLTRRRRR